jgi:hypothetical protein
MTLDDNNWLVPSAQGSRGALVNRSPPMRTDQQIQSDNGKPSNRTDRHVSSGGRGLGASL